MRITTTNRTLGLTAANPAAERILRTSQTLRVVVQGGRGPQGAAASPSGVAYTHDQMIPATIWTINHGMDRFPSATVVDSGGTVVIGEVSYLSANQITITFSAAFAGKAYLN